MPAPTEPSRPASVPSLNVPGTNLTRAKMHNRRAVLEVVRTHGSLTRAEIARLTALTPQTISNIVAELQTQGILNAHDPSRKGRGQPPTPLSINPDGAYSVGLQIDMKSISGLVVDLSGRVRAQAEIKAPRPTPEEAVPLIADLVGQLRASAGVDWDGVLGLGLAIPGPFNVRGLSAVGPTTLPGWWGEDVVRQLAAATGLSAIVENDANAAAIGERLHGVARTLRNFVYMFIGNGLGAGVFLDGQLYRGTGGNAGEIGHMVVVPGGRACPCSNHGCLERYVSLSAAYEAMDLVAPSDMRPEALLDPARRAALEAWLDTAAPPLRQAVNILESIFDMDAVVIGGLLPTPLIEQLMQRLDPLLISVATGRSAMADRVRIGAAGYNTAALGAAALPIFDAFNPQYDVLWCEPEK